jgi:hypothetical protein
VDVRKRNVLLAAVARIRPGGARRRPSSERIAAEVCTRLEFEDLAASVSETITAAASVNRDAPHRPERRGNTPGAIVATAL